MRVFVYESVRDNLSNRNVLVPASGFENSQLIEALALLGRLHRSERGNEAILKPVDYRDALPGCVLRKCAHFNPLVACRNHLDARDKIILI